MKPGKDDNRAGLMVRMSGGQRLLSRRLCPARAVRSVVLLGLVLCCLTVLAVPVAADDSAVNSTATLRISASISPGIGVDVDMVENEDVVIKEETYVDENGTTRVKTVVSLSDTVVEPPEITQSAKKESDLKVTVSSNYDTSWQLKLSSSNEGYMVSSADPSIRMKNPLYFLQDKSDPRFTYVQPDLALLLNRDNILLIRGNSSITNIPIDFGMLQEITWDDMLLADRYYITLSFDVGEN